MRRILHRILTSLPAFVIGLLALLAASNPAGAQVRLTSFVELMSDQRFFWLCVALLVGYFVLWWTTSLEPKPRAVRLREKGLLPIFDQMQGFCNKFRANGLSPDEAEQLVCSAETAHTEIQNWLRANMGEAAVAAYQSGSPTMGFSGSSDAVIYARRIDLHVKNLKALCERPDDWYSVRGKWWRPWHVTRYK